MQRGGRAGADRLRRQQQREQQEQQQQLRRRNAPQQDSEDDEVGRVLWLSHFSNVRWLLSYSLAATCMQAQILLLVDLH